MSNVKVNGNTYADISSVRLPLSDGSGYAVYKEGQSQDENALLTSLLTNNDYDSLGDYSNGELTVFNPSILQSKTIGTWSFPNATVFGSKDNVNIANVNADNLLVPNAVALPVGNNGSFSFRGWTVSGVIDLRNFACSWMMGAFMFYTCTINTLRIDNFPKMYSNMFGSSTITNLVWAADSLTAEGVKSPLNAATAITNLYITDAIYDDVAALIADGTITTVTNLHKYSEWSDD